MIQNQIRYILLAEILLEMLNPLLFVCCFISILRLNAKKIVVGKCAFKLILLLCEFLAYLSWQAQGDASNNFATRCS